MALLKFRNLVMLLSFFWRVFFGVVCSSSACWGLVLAEEDYHVFPGDNIQEALQRAAESSTNKLVKVHAGEYRPNSKRQALIWFNKMHDGIRLEAVGPVTLTSANPQISTPQTPGYPAVVNHVVYITAPVTAPFPAKLVPRSGTARSR